MTGQFRRAGCVLALLIGASVQADTGTPSITGASAASPATAGASRPVPPGSFLSNFDGLDLVDQNGLAFQPAGLMNRVVLFNFIFTRCGSTCPLQTRTLAGVLKELPDEVRDDIRFVSVSIDPANDTPEKLRRFSEQTGADLDGWSFLTGEPRQIERLTGRLHLFDESESGRENRPEIHRTSLWLVDKQGRMLQRYRGNPPDKERLIRELTQVSRMTVR